MTDNSNKGPTDAIPSQADREAAARAVEWQNGTGWEPQFFHPNMPKGIREGAWDNHPLVLAFAGHALATRTATNPAAEGETCPKCGASGDKRCISSRGTPLPIPHDVRTAKPDPEAVTRLLDEHIQRCRDAVAECPNWSPVQAEWSRARDALLNFRDALLSREQAGGAPNA